MEIYFSLINSNIAINVKSIFSYFVDSHKEYRFENISELTAGIKCDLFFTHEYVNDYLIRWKNANDVCMGLYPVLEVLHQKHELEIFDTGLLQLKTNKTKDFEFVSSEIECHYDRILNYLKEIARKLRYNVPIFEKIEISLSLLDEDIDGSIFAKEMNNRIQNLENIYNYTYLNAKFNEVDNILNGIFPLFNSYEPVVNTMNLFKRLYSVTHNFGLTFRRVLNALPSDSNTEWSELLNRTSTVEEHFTKVSQELNSVNDIYSNHWAILGIFGTVETLGFSLIPIFIDSFEPLKPIIVVLSVPIIIGAWTLGIVLLLKEGAKNLARHAWRTVQALDFQNQ